MSQLTELTLQVRPELLSSLDELAGATRRSRSELAEEALAQYLDLQRWQIDGIREAIDEADRGEPGIPHERVAKWLDTWGTDDDQAPPRPRR
jgi:RHH-type transcriptional regulator, rel operon repressor / antitoxin RelB